MHLLLETEKQTIIFHKKLLWVFHGPWNLACRLYISWEQMINNFTQVIKCEHNYKTCRYAIRCIWLVHKTLPHTMSPWQSFVEVDIEVIIPQEDWLCLHEDVPTARQTESITFIGFTSLMSERTLKTFPQLSLCHLPGKKATINNSQGVGMTQPKVNSRPVVLNLEFVNPQGITARFPGVLGW